MEVRQGRMTKASISLQELRRKIYNKAKSEKHWRFWGLYCHICKKGVLQESYRLAKANNGAPGIDRKSFDDVEAEGLEGFLEGIRQELLTRTYRPLPNRRVEIPKGNGKTRTLGIPTVKDRVVQGALKLILEPIFEADFKDCSYGYRPKRHAHQAIDRVTAGILHGLIRVVDVDLSGYFDNIRYHLLLEKVARRVQDDEIMHLLHVQMNDEKTKVVNLKERGCFSFLGFDFRLNKNREGKTYVSKTPREKKRIEVGRKVKAVLKANWNEPLKEVIQAVNAVIRGWVNYFRIGNSNSTFNKVRNDIEKKVRKFVMRRKKLKGFGWKRWSREEIYQKWGLYRDYRIRYIYLKAAPVQ